MSLAAGRGWGQGLSLPFRSGARQGWLSLQLFTIFRSNKNFSPSSVATLSVRKVRPTTPTQRLAGVDGAARPQPSAGGRTAAPDWRPNGHTLLRSLLSVMYLDQV